MTTHAPDQAPMTVAEILNELELYTGRFPKRAMQQAVEQREAITPGLLRVLDEVASDPETFAQRDDYMLLLFAMFLLAQFREKRAYRPIVTIFSTPGEVPERLAGDTVTEGLKQVLGSVYDGDPGPLHRLIEDATVDEYVRAAAIETFVVLWASGQIGREAVVAYYRSLFHGKLARSDSSVWSWLVSAVADLRAHELLDEVRQAFADGLVEWGIVDLDGIERDLASAAQPLRGCHLITDAVAEMDAWACFRPRESAPAKPSQPSSPPAVRATPPAAVPVRRTKVGRNDPCPCGSGKKHKKCCGAV